MLQIAISIAAPAIDHDARRFYAQMTVTADHGLPVAVTRLGRHVVRRRPHIARRNNVGS